MAVVVVVVVVVVVAVAVAVAAVVVVVVPSVILRQCTQIESAKIQGQGVNTQLQEKKPSVQRGFVCCHLICILCRFAHL